MIQPLPGFRASETHHCITGSLRHVYEYHGYPISEDMLLGLGSGVGFLYWHQKGTDPFYGGRANFERPGIEGLERTVGRRTGVEVESHRTRSPRRGESALVEMLDAGQPVMMMVDMGFLPYLDLPEGYHFGGHAVVAAGYEADAGLVLVADRDGVLHQLSLTDLSKARNSMYKPFPPQNQWYAFDFAHKRPPTIAEVRQAIRDTCAGMLEPPISNFGVRGIHTAIKRTVKWPESLEKKQLRRTCFNIFVFIDATGGTGGGIFRYMYGRFLQEAAELMENTALDAVGKEMATIGDRWQEVADVFHRASGSDDPAALLPEATDRMRLIADLEQSAWEKLQVAVGR